MSPFPPKSLVQAENGGGGNRTRERFLVKSRNHAENVACIGCPDVADVLCEFTSKARWWHEAPFALCHRCLEKYADGGWVYFIRAGDLVKIGHSFEPKKRLRSLATASPIPLELWHKLPGSKRLERELHTRFAAERTHGEWFHLSRRLREYVEATHDDRASTGSARVSREEVT